MMINDDTIIIYKQIVKYPIIEMLLVILLSLFFSGRPEECPQSHLDLFTTYSLGKQDELNRTFIHIEEKIGTLDEVKYTGQNPNTYKITGIQPKFKYFDGRQESSIASNDTIVVSGGVVDVYMDFTWSKQGITTNITGTGSAFAISNSLMFAKNISVEEGYFVYDLVNYENVTFSDNSINITRIDPPTTLPSDVEILTSMFNRLDENGTEITVRKVLQEEIEKKYAYYLKASLYDERKQVTDHFEYEWIDPRSSKGNITITYDVDEVAVDIEKTGLMSKYRSKIRDYSNWTCDFWGPQLPLNSKYLHSYLGFMEVRSLLVSMCTRIL